MVDSNRNGNSADEVGEKLEAVLRRMNKDEKDGIASFNSLLERHPESFLNSSVILHISSHAERMAQSPIRKAKIVLTKDFLTLCIISLLLLR